MKMLKRDIRVWGKEVLGKVEVKMKEIISEEGELERRDAKRESDAREKREKGVVQE